MQTPISKPLLKPTHPTQSSIKSCLQFCKTLLQTQIRPNIFSVNQQNRKLKQKLIVLELRYCQEVARKGKIQGEIKGKQGVSNRVGEIQEVRREVGEIRGNIQKVKGKVLDRQELISSDQKYWQNLKAQNEHKKNQVQKIKAQIQKLTIKKQKLDFLKKQLLRSQSAHQISFDKISRQKTSMLQHLTQKNHTLHQTLTKSLQQSSPLCTKITTIEHTLSTTQTTLKKQLHSIKQLQLQIQEQKDIRSQLEGKLGRVREQLGDVVGKWRRIGELRMEVEGVVREFVGVGEGIWGKIGDMGDMGGVGIQVGYVMRMLEMQ